MHEYAWLSYICVHKFHIPPSGDKRSTALLAGFHSLEHVNVGFCVGELLYLLDFQTSVLARSELCDPDRLVCSVLPGQALHGGGTLLWVGTLRSVYARLT